MSAYSTSNGWLQRDLDIAPVAPGPAGVTKTLKTGKTDRQTWALSLHSTHVTRQHSENDISNTC